MQTDFKSFEGVATYLEASIKNTEKATKTSLREIGKYLRQSIRDRHGVKQPGWPVSRNNDTPLLQTGGLRDAVSYSVKGDTVEVFSKKEWLAVIHEYGITYKMTDKQRKFLWASGVFKDKPRVGRPRNSTPGMIRIPARPIWRRILNEKSGNVEAIAERYLETVFT